MKILSPFGPKITIIKIPKKIVDKINKEVDNILSDKKKVTELRIDDDQDSVWMTVDIGDGASCHVGYRSCFYRSIPMGLIDNGRKIEMKFLEKEKKFDPEKVYKGQPNPTKI